MIHVMSAVSSVGPLAVTTTSTAGGPQSACRATREALLHLGTPLTPTTIHEETEAQERGETHSRLWSQ